MGKQGPCCHCGVTTTPLWRNGPPEKPVLCNACGSRWRTKGTLANYTPLHARLDPDDYEDHRVARVKTISLKRKEEKLNKRKLNDTTTDGEYTPDYSQGFQKSLDEDTSNRSSSGSAISNSGSCAQFGCADASDLTGPVQSIVWDTLVPSKKRTFVTRPKQSSVEKLTKDLHTILHEQASHFSGSSEEDLLFESEAPMGSVEFGHGSILIRHPSSLAREDESEASSLSIDNKHYRADESYTTPGSLVSLNDCKSMYNPCSWAEKVKKLNGQSMQLEQAKRDKSTHEKLQILWSHNSPLCQIDLSEIASSDVFWGHLTADEQKNLLKYLPSVDTFTLSESLESMFASPYFIQDLSSFQKLLAEGVLDSSFPGVKTEDCKVVKELALFNMIKCKWVERYNMIKDNAAKENARDYISLLGAKSSYSSDVITTKKLQDSQNHFLPEAKTSLKIPKRVLVKAGCRGKEPVQNEDLGSCFISTSRKPFAMQTDGSSFMLDSFHLENESSDQDLLLEIPSNSSFPQAELLHPASSFASQQASTSSYSIHPALIHP